MQKQNKTKKPFKNVINTINSDSRIYKIKDKFARAKGHSHTTMDIDRAITAMDIDSHPIDKMILDPSPVEDIIGEISVLKLV